MLALAYQQGDGEKRQVGLTAHEVTSQLVAIQPVIG